MKIDIPKFTGSISAYEEWRQLVQSAIESEDISWEGIKNEMDAADGAPAPERTDAEKKAIRRMTGVIKTSLRQAPLQHVMGCEAGNLAALLKKLDSICSSQHRSHRYQDLPSECGRYGNGNKANRAANK